MNRKQTLRALAAAGVLCLSLSACGQKPHSAQFFAMDTYMSLTAYGPRAAAALEAAQQEIEGLEAALSVTREGSEIAALNAAGEGDVSLDTAELLTLARSFSARTGGAFDVTISPLVAAWGFYDDAFRVPDAAELAALLESVGWERVSVDDTRVTLGAGQRIDLGGIAKGYASQRVCRIFDEYGVEAALIALGGNVQSTGAKPGGALWRVAVQHPDRADDYLGVLESSYEAVVTSGDYERFFEEDGVRYHHILDPKTGASARGGLRSVTVVCADAAQADAFSTALFVMGEEAAVAFWREASDFELILFTQDGRLLVAEALAPRFESALPVEVLTR